MAGAQVTCWIWTSQSRRPQSPLARQLLQPQALLQKVRTPLHASAVTDGSGRYRAAERDWQCGPPINDARTVGLASMPACPSTALHAFRKPVLCRSQPHLIELRCPLPLIVYTTLSHRQSDEGFAC